MIPGDTGPLTGGDPSDDDVTGDGTVDEDDHDVATINITPPPGAPIFDLALLKQLADGTNLAVVAPGDSVTFTLTVQNQGTVGATNIGLVDFVPAGLTLADAAWVDNGDGTASLATPIASLAAGASATVDISFTVDADASGTIDNFAAISEAFDEAGLPGVDIDSIAGSSSDTFTGDDVIAESGLTGGDEDDHDRAQLTIAQESLALTGASTAWIATFGALAVLLGAVFMSRSRRHDYLESI